jgi:amidase
LVIDEHPLCPTGASVAKALDGLTERLAKLGVQIVRDTPKLPDLALTTRIYVELLAAFFMADLANDRRQAIVAAAQSLSADDRSIAACRVRGFTGPATLNGLPATTVPIGYAETGLPIGVQIIGGDLNDRTTIAFAGMVEREFGGFTPPPML